MDAKASRLLLPHRGHTATTHTGTHHQPPRTTATCRVCTKTVDRRPRLLSDQALADSCTWLHSHTRFRNAHARTRTATQGSTSPCRRPPMVTAARLYTMTSARPCTHTMNTLPWMVAWGHGMFTLVALLLATPSSSFSTTQFHPRSRPRVASTASPVGIPASNT